MQCKIEHKSENICTISIKGKLASGFYKESENGKYIIFSGKYHLYDKEIIAVMKGKKIIHYNDNIDLIEYSTDCLTIANNGVFAYTDSLENYRLKNNFVYLYNPEGILINVFNRNETIINITLSPNSELLVIQNLHTEIKRGKNNTMSIIDTSTYKIIKNFIPVFYPIYFKFAKDNSYMIMSDNNFSMNISLR